MKKLLSLVLTLSVLLGCVNFVFASEEINVVINDKKITFTEPPVMENDRILVPIRAIAEAIQFDVGWDQNTQKVTLDNFNTTLTFYINQNTIKKDLKLASEDYEGKISTITIDVPARVIEDRTYVPLRAISELFGATVEWDNDNRAANITYDLTYGEPVTFKDKGIEYFCRVAITLGDLDTTNLHNINDDSRVKIGSNTLDLYEGPIYNGYLKHITTLGVNKGYTFSIIVNSLEDISKFPNLENLYLYGQNVKDLTPLNYKSSWSEIDVLQNPIFDFSPLKNIQVNHFIYAGYYDYVFSYINNNYTKNSTLSEVEKEKYDNFASTLTEIFSTMQNVIKEEITPDMSRKEKIEVLNNWIINNIRYDHDSNYFNNIDNFYTTIDESYYGEESDIIECAILHGYAICNGYADVFGIFCDILDIPCVKVYGTANNGEWVQHGWNIVVLEDGNLYHVDTTWNCAGNKYCLISDEEISSDHIWDKEDIPKYFNFRKTQYHFFNSPF